MWTAEMPSNIALIKYMGKKPEGVNRPTNASFSWTLNHLKTKVVIEASQKSGDIWLPLKTPYPFQMSDEGKRRYIQHFHRMKNHFGIHDSFVISSGNNFPADCGIASSASSFAALTEASSLALSELSGRKIDTETKAELSSQGSGSSCRSFYKGWVLWDGGKIQSVSTPYDDLLHMVVIAGDKAKKVSSSQAHKLVPSSPLFLGRVERAEKRLQDFMQAMKTKSWRDLYEIAWTEFWDMHALFETSHPAFGYFLPGTIHALNSARSFWSQMNDGPLVTMDAGPNVHLLWREDQKDQALDYFNKSLQGKLTCLSNLEEIGFAKV